MGIIRNGILGGFRKKVGNIAGAFWRDLNVIKTLPRPSSKPPTQIQIDQRFKFALVTSFLSYISNLIEEFYPNQSATNSAMNESVSYHLKNAITGVSPNFQLDYTKLRFSTGKLSVPGVFDAVPEAGAKIKFTWSENGIDEKYKDGTDMINVLVYDPVSERFVTLMKAAPRSAMEFSLQLPPDMVGAEVYCYFNFTSVMKKKLNSKSVYVGLKEVE